jgi:serine/threonine protein kinase
MADIYSSGDAYWTGNSSISDIYLIHSPLARETFVELMMSKLPYHTRLSAFHQALKGVAHLHSHGIMHRDTKPTNLVVVSYSPLLVVVIDYGNATFERTSIDYHSGTIAYLAPEIMRLKRNDGQADPYNCTMDIWAPGLSGYQLFFQAPCEWAVGMEKDEHGKILEALRPLPGVSKLLEVMLAWYSSERPSAHDLLSRTIWFERINTSETAHAPSAKRSRE